jgi:serine/threonine-protein phosphatase 2A regulatory subunit A
MGEWFTAHVSACGLFHIGYPSATDAWKAELRPLYGQLCHDDMPMVRRAAALNLGKFAATIEPQYLKGEIMTFFKALTQDGKPAVFILWYHATSSSAAS